MIRFGIAIIVLFLIGCGQEKDNKSAEEIGQTTYQGPIIDMHIHAYSEETGGFFFGLEHPATFRGQRFKGAESAVEQREETLKKLEQYRIVKAVVTNGQLWKDVASDRIINANSNLEPDSLRTLIENGQTKVIAEVAPFYRGLKADDTRLAAYFDLAEELGVPVGYHIFPGGPPGGLYSLGLKGMRVANANPMQLEDVLVNRPNLKIYVMHGGWPYLEDMKALMYAHPQIYLDVAVINWILTEQEFHHYLKGLMDAGFGNRIMFGTDQMVWAETIDVAVASIQSASFLTLEQKEDIFYNNAATFLGLTEEEIKLHKGNNN